jgi:hypothetical protein
MLTETEPPDVSSSSIWHKANFSKAKEVGSNCRIGL